MHCNLARRETTGGISSKRTSELSLSLLVCSSLVTASLSGGESHLCRSSATAT